MAEPALKLNETAGDRWGLHEVEGSGLGEVVAGPRRVRTLTMVAIVLLAVLNAADVVTTRMVLDRTAGRRRRTRWPTTCSAPGPCCG